MIFPVQLILEKESWLEGECVGSRSTSRLGASQKAQKWTYTGVELRPHWILEQTKVFGSAVRVFLGPCRLPTEHLVDWEDRVVGDSIGADLMIHGIAEFFSMPLAEGVFAQRLLITHVEHQLRQKFLAHGKKLQVERQGDDIWIVSPAGERRKFSVSIATTSGLSVLIHWGFNVDATGAPPTVAAVGWIDFGFSIEESFVLARDAFQAYILELEDVYRAQCKVRPVSSP